MYNKLFISCVFVLKKGYRLGDERIRKIKKICTLRVTGTNEFNRLTYKFGRKVFLLINTIKLRVRGDERGGDIERHYGQIPRLEAKDTW